MPPESGCSHSLYRCVGDYALKRPDPFPRVFGYHELFHALTIVALVADTWPLRSSLSAWRKRGREETDERSVERVECPLRVADALVDAVAACILIALSRTVTGCE